MPHTIHRQLAERYAGDEGLVEVPVARYVVDAVSTNGEFVEIQTHSFHKVKEKAEYLCDIGRVVLVCPVAYERVIVKLGDGSDDVKSRRRSPRRGTPKDIIPELRWIPDLLSNDSFAIHVVLTREEETRRDVRRGRHWRRRYEVLDRSLSRVVRTVRFEEPRDYLKLLPLRLRQPFTSRRVAEGLKIHLSDAQGLTYALRETGVIRRVGRIAEGVQYVTADGHATDCQGDA